MDTCTLLPDPTRFRLEYVSGSAQTLELILTSIQTTVCCPQCGCGAERVHSRYRRTPADLPWNQVAIRIPLGVRKFFCSNAFCRRAIFTEPLPDFAARYARKTLRLNNALYLLGYSLGGEAGARVALGLGLLVSPDTLLRRVRQVAASDLTETPRVRVVGVDDWAFTKGRRYGTVLVDLEPHRLLDLLPDREAQTLARWLKEHPGIQIVSRDRAGAYADGIQQGLPDAKQVADRRHLVNNLTQALERCLEPNRSALHHAAPLLEETPPVVWPPSKGKPTEEARKQRRKRRLARYQKVVSLHRQGVSKRQIAKQLGIARMTALRSLNAEAFPEIARHKPHTTSLDAYKPYLHRRRQEGCRNGSQLTRELKEQGYSGSAGWGRRYVAGLHVAAAADWDAWESWGRRYVAGLRQAAAGAPTVSAPSARTVACWFVARTESLNAKQHAFLQALCQHVPALQTAYDLAQQFLYMVRSRTAETFAHWLEAAQLSRIDVLKRFANGLEQDRVAVENGLTLDWSNGQTEGQVNRLKLIKRSMYGRAKFDLLRARVLPMLQAA